MWRLSALHCLLCEDLDKQTCGPLPSYLLGTISLTKTYMWPLAYLSVLHVECSSLQNLLAISLFILVLSKLFTIRIYFNQQATWFEFILVAMFPFSLYWTLYFASPGNNYTSFWDLVILTNKHIITNILQERLTCKEQQISENFYVRGDGTVSYRWA